jgi:hypothetical protein
MFAIVDLNLSKIAPASADKGSEWQFTFPIQPIGNVLSVKGCFWRIVLKNSKIAEFRKSRKWCMLAILAAATPVESIRASSVGFAVFDVVPHIAASETHQRP